MSIARHPVQTRYYTDASGVNWHWNTVTHAWIPDNGGAPVPGGVNPQTGLPTNSPTGGDYVPGTATPGLFGPLAQGLDQPVLGPAIHWTPGPAPYVPFMQQPQMPQSIDIQRFISPAVQNLWAQLPQPGQGGGLPGVPNPYSPYGPGTEPMTPSPDPFGGTTPLVPIPTGPTPQLPTPQTDTIPWSGVPPVIQPPVTQPWDLYQQQPYPTLQPAPTYSPTLAPWTDVSMLPSAPSGSMAGWDTGALY